MAFGGAEGVEYETATGRRAARGAPWSMRRREAVAGYLFIAPDAIGLAIFAALPMLLALGLGFYEVDGFGGYRFAGLANYRRMFLDPLFLQSLRVTLFYVLMLVPSLYVVGLGLALLAQRRSRISGLVRSLFFLPQMVSLVVVALVWQVLLVDKIGPVNRLMSLVGLGGLSWLGDPDLALASVVVVSLWFLMGFYMLIFLGGLQDIPREYYEAAWLDGANPIRAFFHITLPLLRTTSFFVLLVATVTAVAGGQAFDLIYVMTKGGPANSTELTIYYIYQQAFQYNEFGYAAAMATTLVAILLAFTFLLFRITRGGRFE
ncbi:carbohydrate ABC transporter permease [Methylocapsa sp. S129]|uniref:carbohydrate ABC transporter permease n=1 Tax=Methylocapsa sp. S129 TaxID=1641869 RepID=UPI00131BEBED|nr:sugar ABC transporter permease [Methylocapsa sp. S129]